MTGDEIVDHVAGSIVDYVHGSERLRAIATAATNAVLEAIREPSNALDLARPVFIPDRAIWREIWAGAIDALKVEIPD